MLVVPAATAADAVSNPPPETPAQSKTGPAVKNANPPLAKGMTAEQVLQIAGKPAEIKPLSSPEGKAEKWIYRRTVDRLTRPLATGVTHVPAYKGAALPEGAVPELSFSVERITIYEVTALLMFDSKLVMAKQWRETSRNITP